jgi:general secretion pathway protein A
MYCTYFGFKERPFSIAPDPSFLYMSELHREALAHLLYGVKSDSGFVLLTGEVGTGKTTICRCLLEQMPETSKVAYVINPRLSEVELLATICDEFGIKYPPASQSIKLFVDLINEYLLAAHADGLKPVLIIDEAQNLSYELLEQVRLLTNLETNERKLLLIVMLGQPELREKLLRPEMRQLQQRITARYHLGPLCKRDTAAYIGHRLAVAGVRRKLFKQPTLNRLFKLSGGVPRLINLLCDRALLGAYAQGDGRIDKQTVQKAAAEIMDGGTKIMAQGSRFSTWALAGALASLIVVWGLMPGNLTHLVDYSRVVAKSSGQKIKTDRKLVVLPSLFQCLPAHHKEIESLAKNSVIAEEPGPALPPQRGMEQVCQETDGEEAFSAPDHLAWPVDQPRERNKIMAYKALFEQWGTSYDETQYRVACNQAMAEGLRCLYKQGNLGSLRRLNRPAVLRFLDGEGQEYFATLVGLQDRTAHLLVGGQSEVVSVDELERQWTGTYTLLWKMPSGYQGAVLPGKSAPWLSWLNDRLAAVGVGQDDTDVDADANTLAGGLLERVKGFQHDNGLTPDGILGPKTIISLNSLVLDSSSPSLSKIRAINPVQISKN